MNLTQYNPHRIVVFYDTPFGDTKLFFVPLGFELTTSIKTAWPYLLRENSEEHGFHFLWGDTVDRARTNSYSHVLWCPLQGSPGSEVGESGPKCKV